MLILFCDSNKSLEVCTECSWLSENEISVSYAHIIIDDTTPEKYNAYKIQLLWTWSWYYNNNNYSMGKKKKVYYELWNYWKANMGSKPRNFPA